MRLNSVPVLCASLLLALVGDSRTPQSNPSPVEEKPRVLSLKITTPETTYGVGTNVPVQIEIQNISEKEVWIGLSLDEELGMPSNLPIWVRDSSRRRVLPEWFIHQSEFGQRRAHESWICLSPGQIYQKNVLLTRYTSDFVVKPGKYEINAYYQGLRCKTESVRSGPTNSACPSSEPTKIFLDKIESNSLSVQIVPSAGH